MQRKKKEREGKQDKMILQVFNVRFSAEEFDMFGKVYNLTPKTGPSWKKEG